VSITPARTLKQQNWRSTIPDAAQMNGATAILVGKKQMVRIRHLQSLQPPGVFIQVGIAYLSRVH